MKKNFKETISELESKINELTKSGIQIEPLNNSVKELKRHTENVEKIEDNIDAIKEEVIDKIKDELEYNKKAGSFSIWGFWIGIIALLVSIFTIGKGLFEEKSVISSTKEKTIKTIDKSLINKIDNIDYKVNELIYNSIKFSNKHKIDSTEFLLEVTYDGRNRKNVIKDSIFSVDIAVLDAEETEINKKLKPSAVLCFYIRDKKIGEKGISEIFRIENQSYFTYNNYYGGAKIFEGDTIKLFLDKFVVERIYLKNTKLKRVGDDKDAVLLKKITDSDYSKVSN